MHTTDVHDKSARVITASLSKYSSLQFPRECQYPNPNAPTPAVAGSRSSTPTREIAGGREAMSMSTPSQSPATAAKSKDSLVFDFINSLSPLGTPKPVDAVRNEHLFKSSDLGSIYPIFISPEINPKRESRQIRDDSPQLSQEVLSPKCQRIKTEKSSYIKPPGSITIGSEKNNIDCPLNDVYHATPENTLGNGKNQNTDVKIGIIDQEHTGLSSICFEQSGQVKTEIPISGRNVQQDNLAKQYNGGLAACNWDQLITQGGSGSAPKSETSFDCEARLTNRMLKTGGIISNNSFLQINKTNLENSRRKLFHDSFDYYNQSAGCVADYIHGYQADGDGGVATNYDPRPRVAPASRKNQFAPNHQIYHMLGVPSDHMPMHCNIISQHQRGMRRRLFNEETRAPTCALPTIGFCLNALGSISEDVLPYNTGAYGDSSNNMPCTVNSRPLISEHNIQTKAIPGIQMVPYSSEVGTHIESNKSSQITIPMITDEPGQESPKRRRRKLRNGDGDSCKHCSCKKSQCLKLYCECFAAKIYCSEYCSCRGCLNNHTHEETVLSTRKQTESRNPLAFVPKVINTYGSGPEIGKDANKTPASARHKRGCNCKKSSCLKKYCECFQIGVGCSISCRCERCKNSFGIRNGVKLLDAEEIETMDKENNSHAKQEPKVDKQHVICQTGSLPTTENLLTTPSMESCRAPLSSTGWNSRLNSHVGSYAGMVAGNSQEEGSSCTTNVKAVVSPNKKRLSIPSFPSLAGDVVSQ